MVSYEETKQFLKEALPAVKEKQHAITNVRIRIDGDTATGKILCFNPMGIPQDDGTAKMTHFGLWYLDKYVRTDKGWRISERSELKSYALNIEGTFS